MTVKFTNGDHTQITEAYRVKIDRLDIGTFEVKIYAASGERTGCHLIQAEGAQFTRAYVMDAGKTIEIVKMA
jgi:hypothetical protein